MASIKTQKIWSNINVDLEDWKDFLDEYEENYLDDGEEMTDSLKSQLVADMLNDYLDDERVNLNVQLHNPILVIADLGLWNGRVLAYKIIESGNIRDILYSTDGDYCEWRSNGKDIVGTEIHHDGTNYYTYREIIDMDTIHNLIDAIYDYKKVDDELIKRYTKSILPSVKKVYGW